MKGVKFMTEYAQLINNLESLDLIKIKSVLPEFLDKNKKDSTTLISALNELTDLELKDKMFRASENLIRTAAFPFRKTLEDFDFSFNDSIDKDYIMDLATLSQLISKLNKAQKENRIDKQLQHFAQYKILIIDEIGYLPIDRQGDNLFFQLISKRYGKKSTIITTNMPFGAWGDVFNDNILASAILDRLLDQAYVVKIVGESYRTKYLAVNKKSAG